MYCPRCGTDRDKNDVTCKRCGYELPPVQHKAPVLFISIVFVIMCGAVIVVCVLLISRTTGPAATYATDALSAPPLRFTPPSHTDTSLGERSPADMIPITLPRSLAGENPDTDLSDAQRACGVRRIERNPDGSITYTMDRDSHRMLLEELRTGLLEALAQYAEDESLPSIRDLSASRDLTAFRMRVNRQPYEDGFDGMVCYHIFTQATVYHLFSGTPEEELELSLTVLDERDGEIIDTLYYPEAR